MEKGGSVREVKKKKFQLNIIVTATSLVCSIGTQQLVIGDAMTQYEKGCLFMLTWLCLNQIFKE